MLAGPDTAGGEAERLVRALRRLDDRVRRWTPTRWAQVGRSGAGTRGEIAYELALTLAALAREAGTSAPDRLPPRLPAYATADQLTVLSREVLAAPDAARVLERARLAVQRAEDELAEP